MKVETKKTVKVAENINTNNNDGITTSGAKATKKKGAIKSGSGKRGTSKKSAAKKAAAKQVATELKKKEAEIRKNLSSIYKVGQLFLEIQEKKLYKGIKCKSFSDYCEKFAQLSRGHIYRMINYAKVCAILDETDSNIPEKTLRPLFSVKSLDDQKKIWAEAKEACKEGELPTTADVEKRVNDFLGKNPQVGEEASEDTVFCACLKKNFSKEGLVQALMADTQVDAKADKRQLQQSASKLLLAVEELKENLVTSDLELLKTAYMNRIAAFFERSVA